MSLVAGVDIGNATTEVALARVTGAGIAFEVVQEVQSAGLPDGAAHC